jgi:predicted DNA-binding transcriptional regulator YafY
VVADAVWQQQRVRVRYERANHAMVERVLEPLGLVLKAGVWYAVAGVADDGRDPRTYRLSRVRAATSLAESFDRPVGFDLEAHWREYQRDYEQRLFSGTATVRVSPTGRRLLFLLGSVAARAAHAACEPPDADGWVVTTVPTESVRHAQHALMQLGADVEVLEPAELRDAVRASAAAMLARYDGSGFGGTSAGGVSAG